jgi:zinc protease
VQSDKTKESLIEFAKEMKGLAGQKPITTEELNKARAVWIRGYAQQFETYGRVGGQIAGLWALGLPMTELQHEPVAVEATTLEQVNAAARKYAVPSAATYLLLGDRARIAAGIRDLGLGEVVVLDEEGQLVASR